MNNGKGPVTHSELNGIVFKLQSEMGDLWSNHWQMRKEVIEQIKALRLTAEAEGFTESAFVKEASKRIDRLETELAKTVSLLRSIHLLLGSVIDEHVERWQTVEPNAAAMSDLVDEAAAISLPELAKNNQWEDPKLGR